MEDAKHSTETLIALIQTDIKYIKEKIGDSPTKTEILLHRWIMGGLAVAIFNLYIFAMGAK